MSTKDTIIAACSRCVHAVGTGEILPEDRTRGYPEALRLVPGPRDERPKRVRLVAVTIGADRCALCGTRDPAFAQGARMLPEGVIDDPRLTSAQVLDRLAAAGRPIAASTWRSYVARGQAPEPALHVGSTPLWAAADIDEWAAR